MMLTIRNSSAAIKLAVILVGYLFTSTVICAADDYQITYLSVKSGLSQNEVTSILQDKYGFMWFGTRGGLNRYDGYEFKHFKPGSDDQNSLHNPSVERLYPDHQGNIWIGTKSGGYSVYELAQEKFHQHRFQECMPNRIISFLEDQSKTTWIGAWSGGLWNYNAKTDSLRHMLGNNRVNTMVQTDDGTVWCGTNDGLRYSLDGETFKTFDIKQGYHEITEIIKDPNGQYLWLVGWDLHLIRFNYLDFTFKQFDLPWDEHNLSPKAYSMMLDKSGDIWVGTWGDGLFQFNKETEAFNQVSIKPKNLSSSTIDFDVILDIFQDPEGDIWLGTDGGGIVRLSQKSRFNTLSTTLEKRPRKRHVNAVLVDSEERLWVGTKGSGLFASAGSKRLKKVGFLPGDRLYNKEGLVVKCIYEDTDHHIWVSFNEGLYLVQQQSDDSFKLINAAIYFRSPDFRQIQKAHDLILMEDELWIATQQLGLFLFNRSEDGFKKAGHFTASRDSNQLKDNRVTTLLKDDQDQLWIGTYKGLYRYHAADSTFLSINSLLPEDNRPLCDIILCTFQDDSGNLWFGTPCSLNKLTLGTEGQATLTDYTRMDGLSDDYINGILDDAEGNIWVSTNAGIAQWDRRNGAFRNYDVSDGVGGTNFSEGACFKAGDGTLYFGGFSDLTYFKPSDIKDNNTTPKIVITDFKILNQEVPISEETILTQCINEQEKIVLTHNEHEFSFEFAALDYKAPQRNQYAYWLEGHDKEPVNIGTRRHISFSNLKPGNYTLHLKGTNSNGVWNQTSRRLAIEVLPAPWKTWYAVIGYVLVILGVVAFIAWIGKKQERLENAAQMEKVLRERDHQMNEYKLKFFTNISHELRTPLTLILAPVNELLKKDLSVISPAFITGKINLIHQSTTRLYNLVNQLLEFRKVEAGKIRLHASEQDLVRFVSEICTAFDELAVIRHITFKKKFRVKATSVFFDSERLGVVMNNLLSNAFKFVGEPGEVEVVLSENETEVRISVMNNGKGIPNHEMKYLFDRFYQTPGKYAMGSSGIGLALVKNYVELHKGEVLVESQPGTLTTFTIVLKKGRQHLNDDEVRQTEPSINNVVLSAPVSQAAKVRSVNTGTKGATVLLVEDNTEVRSYLSDLLSEFYEVFEAEDGVEGFDLAIEHQPHIVISDVMMPRMDGFELCQKIKSNDLISHIPIVLLTAKGTPRDQLFGARKGADVYLTKPFDPDLLLEKVKQLVASRKVLTEKYSQKVKLEPKDAEITSAEGKFLTQAIKVIEKYMGDVKFDPEQLAAELAMSGSTLYRKTKKIAQQTPGEFIKSIRMKRAAQLLRESDLTVSEIIENVGYQDVKNFRRNFKQAYDLTPTEYRKQSGSDEKG